MKTLTIFALLSIICSCGSLSKEEFQWESYCKNEINLLRAENDVPEVEFHLMEPPDKIIQKLDSIFTKGCGPYFSFGWQNQEYKNLKLSFYNPNHCLAFRYKASANINLNGSDEILLDYQIASFDENRISQFVEKIYIQTIEDNEAISDLYINWSDDTSEDQIKTTINSTIKGYLQAVNSLALNKTGKNLCELNSEELNIIKKDYPFWLVLRQTATPPERIKVPSKLEDE